MPAVEKTTEKVAFSQALAYGAGNLAGNILGWGWGSLFPVFNLALGVSPALVGLAQSLPRFVDVFTDPIAGYLSDSLRRKFSRQFFVGIGSVFGGLCAGLLWLFPKGLSSYGYFAWMLAFTSAAMIGWSFLSVPLQALGFEMTRNANERTKLMAVANFICSAAALACNWNYVLAQSSLFRNTIDGVRWVGGSLAMLIVVLGLTSALCCKGGPKLDEIQLPQGQPTRGPTFKDFMAATKRVAKNRPFILLTFTVITMLLGLFGAGMCGTYVFIYFIARGDQVQGMVLFAVALTGYQATSIIANGPVLWIAKRVGKKKALLLFLWIAFAGSTLKWICYNPALTWLALIPSCTFGMGMAALWVLTSSMMGDLCDLDEAASGNQDAGMFSAFYIWTIKLATSLAIGVGGVALSLSGFDVALGPNQGHATILRMRIFDLGFPALFTIVAIVLILRYPITAAQVTEAQSMLKLRGRRPATPL